MRNKKITEKNGSPILDSAMETASQTDDLKTSPESADEKKVAVALFTQLGFETFEDYDAYIGRMKADNYNDILVTINVALRSVSQRGGFNLEENEAVAVALRHLNKAFKVSEPTEAPLG